MFEDSEYHDCNPCDPTCATCDGYTYADCLTCKSGYFFQGGACVNICSPGYYTDVDEGKCKPCKANCINCN